MKLAQLKEVRYSQPLEAEKVLYTLWQERNEIEKDNLSVVQIDDPALSEKRAAAIARYAIRVIAPEALDAIGMIDEAQKLRDLPPDVSLNHARDATNAATNAAYRAGVNDVAYACGAAYNAARAAEAGVDAAYNAAYYAAHTGYFIGQVTNKQRHLYHLNQMIKIAANIK